jgi:hypothetical protein
MATKVDKNLIAISGTREEVSESHVNMLFQFVLDECTLEVAE